MAERSEIETMGESPLVARACYALIRHCSCGYRLIEYRLEQFPPIGRRKFAHARWPGPPNRLGSSEIWTIVVIDVLKVHNRL